MLHSEWASLVMSDPAKNERVHLPDKNKQIHTTPTINIIEYYYYQCKKLLSLKHSVRAT